MKVKIVLNHTDRVSAIKELRQLTGMSLKEAVALIPSTASWGDFFEIDIIGPFNQNKYTQFKITELKPSKKQMLVDELKSLICKAVWDDEVVLVQDLMIALDRANTR